MRKEKRGQRGGPNSIGLRQRRTILAAAKANCYRTSRPFFPIAKWFFHLLGGLTLHGRQKPNVSVMRLIMHRNQQRLYYTSTFFEG